jgi:hypothetical protein
LTSNNETSTCRQCGFPTTWRQGNGFLCPLCIADNLKGGPMVCKKCSKTCLPIGATLRGVQLVGCPNCNVVYADIPGVKIVRRMPVTTTTRGGAAAAHQAHNLKVAGSSPAPATKKKTAEKPAKKIVVKKTKTPVKATALPKKPQNRRKNTVPKKTKPLHSEVKS